MEFSHGNQPSIWGTIYGNTHLGHFSPKIWDIMAAMPGISLSLHVGWVRCKQLKPKLRAGRSANWMIYFSRFQSFRWPRFPQFRCVWLLALRETLQCRAGNDQVETAAIRRCRDLGRPINAGYGHPILRRNQHKVIYRWHSLIASNNTGYFPMKPLKFPMARIENRPPLREARRSGSPAIPRAVVSPPWLQWIMGSCRSLCSGKTWILWDAEDGGIDFPMCLCSKCWSYCKSFVWTFGFKSAASTTLRSFWWMILVLHAPRELHATSEEQGFLGSCLISYGTCMFLYFWSKQWRQMPWLSVGVTKIGSTHFQLLKIENLYEPVRWTAHTWHLYVAIPSWLNSMHLEPRPETGLTRIRRSVGLPLWCAWK